MKIFEELTSQEKEKLLLYTTITGSQSTNYVIVTSIAYISAFISIPLAIFGLYYDSFVLLASAGCIIAIGGLLVLIVIWDMQKLKKQLQLAFGVQSFMRDIFDIKPSDIADMRLKWVKEK